MRILPWRSLQWAQCWARYGTDEGAVRYGCGYGTGRYPYLVCTDRAGQQRYWAGRGARVDRLARLRRRVASDLTSDLTGWSLA